MIMMKTYISHQMMMIIIKSMNINNGKLEKLKELKEIEKKKKVKKVLKKKYCEEEI